MVSNERRGLGRGLSALLADAESGKTAQNYSDLLIPIEKIRPNPQQPRRHFSEEALEELASSIKEKGIIQPLVLRRDPSNQAIYQIVAGERRWRASQIANIHEVPARILELNDTEVLELAIIENIQRADLSPIEEAQGYHQLMDRFGHTQEKLAAALGKSRSHIANLLRLLTLPEKVQDMLSNGQLSAGHARTLVTATDPVLMAQKIIDGGLSVRQAEELARNKASSPFPKLPSSQRHIDPDTAALEADLSASIGFDVSLKHNPSTHRGELKISYSSLEHLDTLVAILHGAANSRKIAAT